MISTFWMQGLGPGGRVFSCIAIARSPSTPPAAALRINCGFAATTKQSRLPDSVLDCFPRNTSGVAMTGDGHPS